MRTQNSSASTNTYTTVNFFGEEDFGTHYIVLAHELNLDHQPPIASDWQHGGFRCATPWPIIEASVTVRIRVAMEQVYTDRKCLTT